jgi:hypothetical protein
MNDIALFALLNFISIFFSVIAVFIVKRAIPLNLRYKDNAVIANTGSTIAVIYGVLAGFAALYLINNNNYASDAVQREANAAADIYRDSKWIQGKEGQTIQSDLKTYISHVIYIEWPLMEKGKTVDEGDGTDIINQMARELIDYNTANSAEQVLVKNMIDEIRQLYDARQQRIQLSYSELSPEVWAVILIGSILTLCINYLFGMNTYLHLVTVCAASLMVSSMLFLLITLDKPFQGEFIIEPDVFQSLLTIMDKNMQK